MDIKLKTRSIFANDLCGLRKGRNSFDTIFRFYCPNLHLKKSNKRYSASKTKIALKINRRRLKRQLLWSDTNRTGADTNKKLNLL